MGAISLNLLSALEPILGVSVALNLAYLNIRKFHYISIVKERLTNKIQALDQNVRNSVEYTPWYVQLKSLADVDPLDLEWPNLTKKLWISSPGLWGAIYNVFFYWRIGKAFSIIATFYSLFLLMLGAGLEAGATDLMRDYFNTTIGRHFFWSVFAALWPIASVAAGEYVCLSATRFVNYQTDNLKAQARTNAERVVDEITDQLEP